MKGDLLSCIVIWLLALTTSIAQSSHQNQTFISVTTGEVTINCTEGQMTTHEVSNLHPQVSGPNIRPSIAADEFSTAEKTTNPCIKTSLPTTQTPPQTRFLTIQTAATPAHSNSSQLNNSKTSEKATTEVQVKDKTTTTLIVTTQASNPTTITRAHSMLTSFAQSQGTRKTSTFQFNSDKMTNESTRPAESTHTISTATTSIKTTDNTPTTTRTATQSTGLSKTSVDMIKTPFIHITKRKEKKAKSNKDTNQSKIVAGIIGGALVVMMVGFLVIFINKRKFQNQQSTDWAGPSPFLESGADNGAVKLRSLNRVSLASFLPQRLSKRLSLLPEMGEELEDMAPGTTFGNKHTVPASGQENEETNGTTIAVPEIEISGDALETVENSITEPSSQVINPPSTNNISGAANLSEDSANSP